MTGNILLGTSYFGAVVPNVLEDQVQPMDFIQRNIVCGGVYNVCIHIYVCIHVINVYMFKVCI